DILSAPPTTGVYTLPLHDALPIWQTRRSRPEHAARSGLAAEFHGASTADVGADSTQPRERRTYASAGSRSSLAPSRAPEFECGTADFVGRVQAPGAADLVARVQVLGRLSWWPEFRCAAGPTWWLEFGCVAGQLVGWVRECRRGQPADRVRARGWAEPGGLSSHTTDPCVTHNIVSDLPRAWRRGRVGRVRLLPAAVGFPDVRRHARAGLDRQGVRVP